MALAKQIADKINDGLTSENKRPVKFKDPDPKLTPEETTAAASNFET